MHADLNLLFFKDLWITTLVKWCTTNGTWIFRCERVGACVSYQNSQTTSNPRRILLLLPCTTSHLQKKDVCRSCLQKLSICDSPTLSACTSKKTIANDKPEIVYHLVHRAQVQWEILLPWKVPFSYHCMSASVLITTILSSVLNFNLPLKKKALYLEASRRRTVCQKQVDRWTVSLSG